MKGLTLTPIALVTTTLLLTGCGGGGGGGSTTTSGVSYTGPTGTIILDAATGDQVAFEASTVGASDSLSPSSLPIAVVGSGDPVARPALTDIARSLTDRVLSMPLGDSATAAGAVQSETQACAVSGTKTVSFHDNDDSSTFSSGDAMSLQYSACKEISSIRMDGGFTFTFNSVGDYGYSLDGMDVTIEMDQLKTTYTPTGEYYLMDGDMSMSAAADPITPTIYSYTIEGTSLLMADSSGNQSLLENYIMTDTDSSASNGTYSRAYEYDLSSTLIGGHVHVITTQAIVIYVGDYYPYEGQVVVTGSGGAKVRLTAVDNTNVTIEYDVDPVDGTYETTVSTTWCNIDDECTP